MKIKSEEDTFVFYNNKTYEIITILTPNNTEIDYDDFIATRIKYDQKCKGLTSSDISYSLITKDEYQEALSQLEQGGNIFIDIGTDKVLISGIIKDEVIFDTIEKAYEFHIECNTKILSSIYNIEFLEASKINTDIIHDIYTERNNYFNSSVELSSLSSDIQINGMYFPFIGYYDIFGNFIVTEGTHRAQAIQSIGGSYLCISNTNRNLINLEDKTQLEDEITFYDYVGNLKFIRRTLKLLNAPALLYVSNNIKLSNEIFSSTPGFKAYNLLYNNKTRLNSILSESFVRTNKEYYSLTSEEVQSIYNKYILNLNLFELTSINIDNIHIEDIPEENIEALKSSNPFIASMTDEEIKDMILEQGLPFPILLYYKEDGLLYASKGQYFIKILKEFNISCNIKTIIYDKIKTYSSEPSYADEFEKSIYVPKEVIGYEVFPYTVGDDGLTITEELEHLYEIKVVNDTQLIQAYNILSSTLIHMINFLRIRHGINITYVSNIEIL